MKSAFAIFIMFLGTSTNADTIVAARMIRAQETLSISDIRVVSSTTAGAHSRVEDVLGKETRITLYPGTPIMKGQVIAPAVIERNEFVSLTFQQGGLQIMAEGRALGRGGVGDSIRVMNTSSKAVLFGTINADGTVTVGN